ncbi:MAG: relaxase/mobilization nuclease domain-containing protein [Ghiorsea sp.]|nr:relaxase/mobilization nuclease domain-containing protein [Ghiorsea sp.]
MHIKFSNPKADVKAAVGYVMRQTQPKKPGEEIEVLRGDPQTTQDLAMSLDFKNTYSSAVIRWHRDDSPTPAQIDEVIDSFESFSFAGLERDSYDMLVVQHTENNDPHLHLIIPRVELTTGKSMNIAPPKFNKDHCRHHEFDHIRDFFNEKYGWKSPDIEANPENARTIQLGLNRGRRKKLMQSIDDYVTTLIKTGDIRDRATLCTQLEQAGLVIKNQKNKYITVRDPQDEKMKKGMRLNGEIYAKDFTVDKWLENESSRKGAKAQENPLENLGEIEERLRNASKKRADYSQRRYNQTQSKPDEQDATQGLELDTNDSSLPYGLPSDLRADMAPVPRQNNDPRWMQTNHTTQSRQNFGMQSKFFKKPKNSKRQRYNLSLAQLDTQLQAILWLIEAIVRMLGFNLNLAIKGVQNDRNRNQISAVITGAEQANELVKSNIIRASAEHERRADELQQILSDTAREFKQANRRLDDLGQRKQAQEKNNNDNFNY